MAEVDNKEKDERVEKIMEDVLGISLRTNLEKVADSFIDVSYCIHPNRENPEIGFIEFAYRGYNIYTAQEKRSEIEKVAERFYNKDDYMVIVTTSDHGFNITILENFVEKAFKEVMEKKSH